MIGYSCDFTDSKPFRINAIQAGRNDDVPNSDLVLAQHILEAALIGGCPFNYTAGAVALDQRIDNPRHRDVEVSSA